MFMPRLSNPPDTTGLGGKPNHGEVRQIERSRGWRLMQLPGVGPPENHITPRPYWQWWHRHCPFSPPSLSLAATFFVRSGNFTATSVNYVSFIFFEIPFCLLNLYIIFYGFIHSHFVGLSLAAVPINVTVFIFGTNQMLPVMLLSLSFIAVTSWIFTPRIYNWGKTILLYNIWMWRGALLSDSRPSAPPTGLLYLSHRDPRDWQGWEESCFIVLFFVFFCLCDLCIGALLSYGIR